MGLLRCGSTHSSASAELLVHAVHAVQAAHAVHAVHARLAHAPAAMHNPAGWDSSDDMLRGQVSKATVWFYTKEQVGDLAYLRKLQAHLQ